MGTITVLPCPFCGYHDVEIDEIDMGICAVLCPECQTIGPHEDTPTAEAAISAWNRRSHKTREGQPIVAVLYGSKVVKEAMDIGEAWNSSRDYAAVKAASTKWLLLTPSQIDRMVELARKIEEFNLYLTDEVTTVAVAVVLDHKGFTHACEVAIRKYSGLVKDLDLPTWVMTDGRSRLNLFERRQARIKARAERPRKPKKKRPDP
jgi:Lar family restriction alleviation protein